MRHSTGYRNISLEVTRFPQDGENLLIKNCAFNVQFIILSEINQCRIKLPNNHVTANRKMADNQWYKSELFASFNRKEKLTFSRRKRNQEINKFPQNN